MKKSYEWCQKSCETLEEFPVFHRVNAERMNVIHVHIMQSIMKHMFGLWEEAWLPRKILQSIHDDGAVLSTVSSLWPHSNSESTAGWFRTMSDLFSCFLLQYNNMQVNFTGDSKFDKGMTVYLSLSVFLCVGSSTDCKPVQANKSFFCWSMLSADTKAVWWIYNLNFTLAI